MSHGPARLSEREWSEIPAERREAASETFMADLAAATQYQGHLAMLVKDGECDEKFEPVARAIVHTGDNRINVSPIEGFRGN